MSLNFDEDFELEMLAQASRDARYRKRLGRVIKDIDPWSTATLREMWTLISALGDQDTLTSGLVIKHADTIKDDDEAEEVIAIAREVIAARPTSSGYAVNALEQWARKAVLTEGVARMVRHLAKDDIDEAEAAARKLQNDPSSRRGLIEGGDWFGGFDDRQRQRELEKTSPEIRPVIPTKIASIDDAFNGGIRLEEFGLVTGRTNVGKSFFCQHLAYVSALSSFQTIYVSTEMSRIEVDTRLDARFLSRPSNDFYAYDFSVKDLERFERKRARLEKRLLDKLHTYAVPVNSLTKAGLEEIIDETEEKTGHGVSLVVMDTADHMQPMTMIREKRLQQSAVYWDIKAIVGERGLACWTSVHVSDTTNKLLTEFDQAESKEKGKIADKIITLNQTPAEYREDVLRAYVAKNRSGKKGGLIWIGTDYARATIMEIEAPGDDNEEEE